MNRKNKHNLECLSTEIRAPDKQHKQKIKTRCRTGMKRKTIVNFVQRRKQIDKNKPTFFSLINYLIMLMTLKFCASAFIFLFVFRYILNDFILFNQGLSIYFESAAFLSFIKKFFFYFCGHFFDAGKGN